MTPGRFPKLPLGLAMVLTGLVAQAQEELPLPASGGMAGLMVGAGYQYLGSDEHRSLVMPMLDYRWANGWYAGVRGVGYRLASTPAFELGLGLGWDGGRKESRSDALRGMGDIDARPEAMGFARWQLTRAWDIDGELRYGAGNDRRGLQLNMGMNYGFELSPGWRLTAKLGASFANAHSMQENFGVSAAQASRTGYAGYETGAGLRDVRLGLSLSHPLSRDWLLSVGVDQVRLQGDAKDSPLVREANPLGARLLVGYRF